MLTKKETKLAGEYGSYIDIDTIGSEITSLDGKIAAFSIANGTDTEYFIARVNTTDNRLENCYRGYFFDGSQAPIPRIVYTNNDTITLMHLTWVFATTAGALAVSYTNPTISADAPGSPAINDYWFDTANDKWKVRSSGAWDDADATLIGVCFQDSNGNTLGARAF